MANYVLVHGSGHGSWCWERVVPLLQAMGHGVMAVDLPGNGHDDTPLADVTLDTYGEFVAGVLDTLNEPVVLVGHSLGGVSISRAAELRPDRIAVLVYLTALMYRNGESFVAAASSEPSEVRRALESRTTWHVAQDLSHVVYKPELTRHRFYNDCSPDDAEWAKSMLVPQPTGPLVSPMRITEANFGRVHRVYIECSLDNGVTPDMARAMYNALPCDEVITMNTGHSPFLSAPEELASHLHALSRYTAESTGP